jgi:hypothetical protein
MSCEHKCASYFGLNSTSASPQSISLPRHEKNKKKTKTYFQKREVSPINDIDGKLIDQMN